ncbi:MAG: glycoside hydrolase family 9 protein [Fibromonadaceae bacterium]|jgi:endoglucanase|nr:glycoside hydrolase family 9 protein [Fibromonadaceae bacterium]
MKHFLIFLVFMAIFAKAENPGFGARINQLGYGQQAKKILIYKDTTNAESVEFRDLANEQIVLTAPLSPAAVWEFSGESVRKADFSSITKPGLYAAYIGEKRISDNIFVQNNVYEDLFKAAIKWFYYQRAGMALAPEFAGKWARAAGHPDTAVYFYPESEKPADWKISSPKGWYDAGDYGKYIVNSGISVFTLLEFYEHFETQLKKVSLNIPESKSKTPDILEEVRWNLDWMLTMQDPADGGVYHKLTTARFCGRVMPDADIAKRYVVMKTTAATFDFAAVMAQAARIYKPFDAKFSQTALNAAERAFDWAIKNPVTLFKQPEGMNTGQYHHQDETTLDERLWAATELFISTKKKVYADVIDTTSFASRGPWWGDVNFLAVYRLSDAKNGFKKDLTKAAQDTLLKLANHLKSTTENSAYNLPIVKENFVWGSNSVVANNGIVLLHAYYLTKDKSYLDAAQRALDYILGANPLDISYVTGHGNRTTKFPHHRPSDADAIFEAVPGMLAGGAHDGGQDVGPNPWQCEEYRKLGKPALGYIDDWCSYASNEVAINWNAPLAYLAGALHYLNNGIRPK